MLLHGTEALIIKIQKKKLNKKALMTRQTIFFLSKNDKVTKKRVSEKIGQIGRYRKNVYDRLTTT